MTSNPSSNTEASPAYPSTAGTSGKRSKSPSSYRKHCDLCHTPNDVLVRCRIDHTREWRFVCTRKCWRTVSGGEIDGPDKPFYVYGGMWKNKHAGVSAKKPQRKAEAQARDWDASGTRYVTNDTVSYGGKVWVCRRCHRSDERSTPGVGYTFWKEHGSRMSDNTQITEQETVQL